MRLPAVSVIMPVHNAGKYLAPAVASVLEQHDVELELIIIDDHSSDSAIAQLPKDDRIRKLQASNRGIVSALNLGIAAAKHEVIARMDGDDICLSHRLKTQLNFLCDNPLIDVVGAQVKLFCDGADLGKGYRLYQDWINKLCSAREIADNFYVESCIPHPSAMFRRSLIDEVGGYRDCAWPEDYDLWCRAHLAHKRFAKPANDILLRWRDHPNRTSRVDTRYSKTEFLRCKAHYLARQLHAQKVKHVCIWGAGPTGLKMHDFLSESGVDVRGFIDVNPKLINRHKRDKPVLVLDPNTATQVLSSVDSFVLPAVSARGARADINDLLLLAGKKPGRDFLCIA